MVARVHSQFISMASFLSILTALALPYLVLADPLSPPSIGDITVHELGNAMRSAQAAARDKAELNKSIADARKRYFSALPDGPGLADAKAEFQKLLSYKDFYYFIPDATAGYMGAKGRGPNPGSMLDTMTGGPLDGGIRWDALKEYREWIAKVRENAGVGDNPLLVISDRGTKAIEASKDEYQKYIEARDQSEYINGFHLIRFASNRERLISFFAIDTQIAGMEKAIRQYDEMEKVFGAPVMDGVAAKLQALAEESEGEIKWDDYVIAFYQALSSQSKFLYWSSILGSSSSGLNFNSPLTTLSNLFEEYGKENVLATMKKLEDAPQDKDGWLLDFDPEHSKRRKIGDWFLLLLEKPETQLPTFTEMQQFDLADVDLATIKQKVGIWPCKIRGTLKEVVVTKRDMRFYLTEVSPDKFSVLTTEYMIRQEHYTYERMIGKRVEFTGWPKPEGFQVFYKKDISVVSK